ncbi:hypothetical protein FRC07_005802 [Ceratobasidium sp. 392]|nr:hypothetical protein FRC07_005802 [Ceratobasidium sp. 392]
MTEKSMRAGNEHKAPYFWYDQTKITKNIKWIAAVGGPMLLTTLYLLPVYFHRPTHGILYGGPGGSGLSFLYNAGSALRSYWTIASKPVSHKDGTAIDCHSYASVQGWSATNHKQLNHTHFDIGLEARNLSDPIDRTAYTQQVRKAYSESAVIGELCFKGSEKALRHAGTATVVRDLELLSRIIEGSEEPINFLGYSYGTVICSYVQHSHPWASSESVFRYFVNMSPRRVGRVAIDGVVDPITWTAKNSYEVNLRYLADIEKTYTNFLQACANAGSGRCALNTDNTSIVAAIREAVDKLIQDLYEHPIPVPLEKQPYILTSGMIRSILLVSMYSPRTWAGLAKQPAAAMRGDGAPIADALIKTIELDTTVRAKTVVATAAVVCADGPDLRDVEPDQAIKDMVEAIVLTYETVSRRNTADPVTPLASARLVNELIPQSRLVIPDGSGHCSDAMASPCTGKVLRSYLLDGVLPPNGIVCDTVEELFPNHLVTQESKTRG